MTDRPLPPKPVVDADTAPFWDAVSERRLVVQRCGSCAKWIWQPRPVCHVCRTPDPVWTEVSGDGEVTSWTVLHPPVLPVWAEAVPMTVLLVTLDEGVRMLGQLVDDAGQLVKGEAGVDFGRRVALRWRTDEAGQTLPAWTPA